MKRLLIFNSVLLLATIAARAQAYINADNLGCGVNIMVYDPAISSSPVIIGTPAAAAGYVGVGPEQVSFSLYAALNGTSLSTLESAPSLIATGINVAGVVLSVQGAEDLPNPLELPSLPGFTGIQPLEFIMLGVSAGGEYRGWSAEATGIVPATGTGFPTDIFGTDPGQINSFLLTSSTLSPVPEPATFAVAGIGAAMLAMFRRRK